jgi:hypothetical protein
VAPGSSVAIFVDRTGALTKLFGGSAIGDGFAIVDAKDGHTLTAAEGACRRIRITNTGTAGAVVFQQISGAQWTVEIDDSVGATLDVRAGGGPVNTLTPGEFILTVEGDKIVAFEQFNTTFSRSDTLGVPDDGSVPVLSDGLRLDYMRLSGALTAARTVKVAQLTEQRPHLLVRNATTGGFAVTVKSTATGDTGVSVAANTTRHLVFDYIDNKTYAVT